MPRGATAALAVSGGADSFALLHWAWEAGHPVVALTVDHALRAGSAAEAQAVAAFCEQRDLPHETLAWRGEKPETGIQAAARHARYRLLVEACYRRGIAHLVTAHTADDQAETVFMRLRRGAGRGLAGMRPRRMVAAGPGEPIALHRPLLDMRRAALRAYAEDHALPFTDDPSNDDERYERVRVRALLAALEQQDLLTVKALCRTANHIGSSLPSVAEMAERAGTVIHVSGEVSLSHVFDIGEEERDTLVVDVLEALGGGGPLRSVPSLRPTSTITCNGVTLVCAGSGLLAYREPAALLGRSDRTPGFTPIPAPPGSKHLYDRRFIVEVPADAPEGLELRPLGQTIPRDIALSTPARQRISTLPCLAGRGRCTYLPDIARDAVTHALAGWKDCDRFLPSIRAGFPARSCLHERFAGNVIRF